MQYRPEIDGLRTLAVVPVVLFHAGLAGFQGGFVGVDVFFVISGYLITVILLEDLERGRFSVLGFYERRARRILPALGVVVAAAALAAPFVMRPDQLTQFAQSVAATALFAANAFFWWTTDYFGGAAEEKPLLHMWSLAVEEQFYVVFPLALWLLWRTGRRDRLAAWFAAAALLSFGLAEGMSRAWPLENFYGPATRAWELLAGSLVALRLRGAAPERSALGDELALAGLAMIVASVALVGPAAPYPSLWTAPAVLGTALTIRYARTDGAAGRLLALRPMVFVGLLSYSIYLWHQPLFAFARLGALREPGIGTLLALSALCVPLAWISWRYVERPFRDRARIGRRAIFALSVATLGAMTAVGVGVAKGPGVAEALSWTARLDAAGAARMEDQARLAADHAAIAAESDLARDPGCRLLFQTAPEGLEARIEACAARHGPGVLVAGGSHGIDLYRMLERGGDAPFLIGLARGWCRAHRALEGPPPHECPYDAVLRLARARPDALSLVIYTQAAHPMFEAGRGLTGPGDGFHPELADEAAAWAAEVARAVPVLILGPQPMLGADPRKFDPRADFAAQAARSWPPGIAAAEAAMAAAQKAAAERVGVPWLSKAALMGASAPRDALIDGRLAYRDQDHLSLTGIDRFGRRLVEGLAAQGYGQAASPR